MAEPGSPDKVVICIPTFRRPKSLKRLLDAIALLKTDADIRVLVADNDAESHAGLDLCRAQTAYRWPLTAVIAGQRGISHARNTLMENALASDAQFFVMIDDDEWPQQGWITEFLKAARATGADLLQGSILFGHDGSGDGHADIRRATGPVAMLQGAGNLLIRRAVLEDMRRPWFDPQFALSGGEDRDFFERLARAGKRMAWCDEARALGEVPGSRASLSWSLLRAYSIGNSDMRVMLKHRPGALRLTAELLKILALLLLSPLLLLFAAAAILVGSPNRGTLVLQKLFRAAGKLTAMFGARYNEYAMVHGE